MLAGREAVVSVRCRRLSRRKWLMDSLYTGWNRVVCWWMRCLLSDRYSTFKWWSRVAVMTSTHSTGLIRQERAQDNPSHSLTFMFCTELTCELEKPNNEVFNPSSTIVVAVVDRSRYCQTARPTRYLGRVRRVEPRA